MMRSRTSILRAALPPLTLAAAAFVACATIVRAQAQQTSLQVYNADHDGTELSGKCLLEDKAGFLYVCTDHGLLSFDGRQFSALGPAQNLPSMHDVFGIALSPSGRLAVRYANSISIADLPGSTQQVPASMLFRALPSNYSYPTSSHSLAPWRDGIMTINNGAFQMIAVPSIGAASVADMAFPEAIRLPHGVEVKSLFNLAGDLWFVRSDGRICTWSSAPRCYGPADGLPSADWTGMTTTSDGAVLARSPRLLATLARGAPTWTVASIPGQNGTYDNYPGMLALFHAPDGSIMTQAAHGLAIMRDGRWEVASEAGAIGIITSSLVDRSGSLWIQSYDNGIVRRVNFGGWQTLTHADGLSSGLAWQTAASGDGSVWIATDTAVDQVVTSGGRLVVKRQFPGAAYSLAMSGRLLWSSAGETGARLIDPATGAERKLPKLDSMLMSVAAGSPGTTWLGTVEGLFRCEGDHIETVACTRVSSAKARDMQSDGAGGLFYLSSQMVRHRAADGTDTLVVGHWPISGFSPVAIVRGAPDILWVGGDGGLFRVTPRAGAPPLVEAIPQSDLGTSSLSALLVDRRGWLWVGANTGLSVFDGHHWVTLNVEDGLPANDIDERGLREDADGTIWITSSAGVSHLLHPEKVFAPEKLEVVVSRASLDGRMIRNADLPFNRKPLLIEVGTPAYTAQQSVTFRYRMSGVDEDWIETSSGRIFYPFVPPGRHRFEVLAYDSLKHRVSAPATLRINIAFPWWRQWWSETLWALAIVGVLYGLFRLRVRTERARQTELERRVAEVTAEIRRAQAELAYQATHDQLTSLLNRSAIENKLAEFLREGSRTTARVVVGLVDVDHFKAINDGWGHLTGDAVLREMGALTAAILRADEYGGRYGGEEILVVLQNTDGRAVSRLAEFHQRVRMHSFGKAGSPGVLNVTCSIGMAAVFDGDSWESLIGRADRALYNAKRSGRDRIAGLAGSTGSHEGEIAMGERARSHDGP